MDPSSIPKQYGGDLDWTWGDMPNLDQPAKDLIGGAESGSGEGGKKEFLKGPMLFDGEGIRVLGREKKGGEGGERRWDIPAAANGATAAAPAPAPAPAQEQAS